MTMDRQWSALALPPGEAARGLRISYPGLSSGSLFTPDLGCHARTQRCGRAGRSLAVRLGQLVVVATLALGTLPAWAEPAAPIQPRLGNHPGFGRLVFDFAARTAYQQVRAGDTLSLRFAADVVVTPTNHPPHNVDAMNAQPGVVDLVVAAGATTHVYWLGNRLVVDVYDPAATATMQPAQAVAPAQGAAAQAPSTLALPALAPSSGKPVVGLPTSGAASGDAPAEAPVQAAIATPTPTPAAPPSSSPVAAASAHVSRTVVPAAAGAVASPTKPTVLSPAPPALPVSPAAPASTHVSRTVVSAAQFASILPMLPAALSPPQATPAGTPPEPPATQTVGAPGHSGRPVPLVQAAVQPAALSAVRPPDRAAVQPPDHAAVRTATQSAPQPPDHAAVQPPGPAAIQPAARSAAQPPDHAAVQALDHTAVQPPVQPQAAVTTQATTTVTPAEPSAPLIARTDTPPRVGMVLALAFPTSVGVAAFRRGDSALVVFDERRPIDLAAARDDPVFGTA
jgi:hypothetical protein